MQTFKKEQLRLQQAILSELKILNAFVHTGAKALLELERSIRDLEKSVGFKGEDHTTNKKTRKLTVGKEKKTKKKGRKYIVRPRSNTRQVWLTQFFADESTPRDAYKAMCEGKLGAPMKYVNFRSLLQSAEYAKLVKRSKTKGKIVNKSNRLGYQHKFKITARGNEALSRYMRRFPEQFPGQPTLG